MKINSRIILAVVLNMLFLGLGFLTWLASLYLANVTGWSYKIFDFIALCLCFCGFMSICIIGDRSINDGKERTENH